MHVDASRDALSGHLLLFFWFSLLHAPCVLFCFILFLQYEQREGEDAARLLIFVLLPCSADRERDWPPCKVAFSGWQSIVR